MKKTWITMAALLFGAQQPTVNFESAEGSVSLLEEHMDTIEATLKTQGEAIKAHAGVEQALKDAKTASDALQQSLTAEQGKVSALQAKLDTATADLAALQEKVTGLPANDDAIVKTGSEGGGKGKKNRPYAQFITN